MLRGIIRRAFFVWFIALVLAPGILPGYGRLSGRKSSPAFQLFRYRERGLPGSYPAFALMGFYRMAMQHETPQSGSADMPALPGG